MGGRLTEEQIERMIKEAEEFAEEDKALKEKVDARNAFDNYLHSMKSAVEGSGENMGEARRRPWTMRSRTARTGFPRTRMRTRRRSRRSRRRLRASAARSSRSTTRALVPVVATTTMRATTTRRMTSSKPTWLAASRSSFARTCAEERDADRADARKAGSWHSGETYRAPSIPPRVG